MQTETLRTIKYTPETALKMDKVALRLGRSNRLVFAQMVDYFYRSKKDPLDINDELLKNTLLKQHRDYIGFIKIQENSLLIPIKREVDRMIRNQKDIVNFFNALDGHNKVVLASQQDLQSVQKDYGHRLTEATGAINLVSAKLITKENLKSQFRFILDHYIKSRDAFGMMTSAREKDELVRITRNQIDLL